MAPPPAPAVRAAAPSTDPIRRIAARYDPGAADLGRGPVRLRLCEPDGSAVDAVVRGPHVDVEPTAGDPVAVITAPRATWQHVAEDARGGMAAFEQGKLRVRGNLHAAIGFLAATGGVTGPERLELRMVHTRHGRLSTAAAGSGPPVIAIHGLGSTKASMLATVARLGHAHRVIALDLPGFGDSGKPFAAPYDARFFAETVVDLLDALGLERASLVGNSLGGRTALEVGLRFPERVDRLVLLAPSMAWRKARPYAPLLRLVRPELGVIQPAPRKVVEAIVGQVVPGASNAWIAAGVDDFLRAYLTPRGRAAFYAAARQIYLERPDGPDGFWPRLRELSRPSLFVWGRQDTLVPIAFARHVTEALPVARHLELNCGHVPQLERPVETHRAIERFLAGDPAGTR